MRVSPLLKAAMCVCAALIFILTLKVFVTGSSQDVLVLETEHAQLLEPHTHDTGDSINDEGHHRIVKSNVATVPEDIWITGATLEVVNAPSVVLHHALVATPDKRSFTCPELNRALFGFGADHLYDNSLNLPEGYAIFMPKNSRIGMGAMFHNPLPPQGPGGAYKDVSAKLTLHIISKEKNPNLIPVSQYGLHLDDVGCKTGDDQYEFTVPPNTNEYAYSGNNDFGANPAQTVMNHDGKIVYSLGHLHAWQGGKSLLLRKNGEEITRFEPVASAENPYQYDTPRQTREFSFKTGDTLGIEAMYDNPHSIPLRGAMGIVSMYITD